MGIYHRKTSNLKIAAISLVSALALAVILSVVSLITFWFSTNPYKMIPPEGAPSPVDGTGSATISPDVVAVGDAVDNFTITYTVGPNGLGTDATIDLFYPSQIVTLGDRARMYVPYLAWKSIQEFMDADVSIEYKGDAKMETRGVSFARKLRLIMGYFRSKWRRGAPAYSARDIAREFARKTIKVTKGALSASEEIKIVISKKKGFVVPAYAGWVNFSIVVDGDGDGVGGLMNASPRVAIAGKKATGFRVTGATASNIWEPISLDIEAIDDDGQVVPSYAGTVYIDAPQLALPSRVEFTIGDLGRKALSFRTSQQGVFFVLARDEKGRKGRSNPIVVRDSGPHIFWGDLHLHSVLGIGDNTPEYVLRTARDDLSLDFAGVVMVDNDVPLISHDKLTPINLINFSWEHLQQVTHSFDEEQKFIAFPVFDWASNSLGHRLVVYSPDEIHTDLMNHADVNFDTVEKLQTALADRKVIIVPIWSGWRGGKFMGKKYDWGAVDNEEERLAEVYSSDGAVEYHDNPFPIHATREVPHLYNSGDQASHSSKSFVRDALAEGRKMGLIAGGARRFSLDAPSFYQGGLTAVWAQRLTGPEIWDSLYSRRVYATTGARIYIEFKVNGAGPGEKAADTEAATIDVFIAGTAQIEEAQILKFSSKYKIASSLSSKTEELRFNWVDIDPPHGGFYVLRVIQKDGQMAWAGPIWLGGE